MMAYTEMKNETKVLQLINVTERNGELLVSGRDLHEALEVRSKFNDWVKNMIDYGFEENIDYTKILVECIRGQNRYDYALKIDMAKQIAMIQRSDKGKQIREYFIECEKQAKQQLPQITQEERLILNIAMSQDKAQQAIAVQEYGAFKWDKGHEIGYTEGHEVGYTQGHVDGYTECGKTEYITTTKVVHLINERAGGSFDGHKLTTIELFEWLEYLGWGEYKLPHEKAGKRKFFASQEFMNVLLEDKLGQVNIINGRHEIKWTRDWAYEVGLDNIGGWLKNRGAKSFK